MFKVEYTKEFIEGYLQGTEETAIVELPSQDMALRLAEVLREREPRRDPYNNELFTTKEVKVIKV